MPSEDPPASFPEATNAVLTKDSGTLEEGQEGLHPRTESGCEAEAAPDSEGSPEACRRILPRCIMLCSTTISLDGHYAVPSPGGQHGR